MSKKHLFPPFVLFSSLVAAIGSFLFGYHVAIISGAVLFIAKEFGLTDFQQELVISITLFGCIFGALTGGISDYFGRKRTLLGSSTLFLIGTFFLFEADSFLTLLLGRLLVGVAIGVASITVPLYIAEIAPAKSRGRLVSINQLMVTVGILISFVIAYVYSDDGDWRTMFAFALLPTLLQFLCLFLIPETPAWLLGHNQKEKAEKALHQLRIASIAEDLVEKEKLVKKPIKHHFRDLFAPSVRAPFLIGIGISIFQQITGINTVIYYAPRIFQFAGFPSAESAILATVWIGVVNVIMTVVGLWLVDRVGRRPLLLSGVLGMAISLAVLGAAFQLQGEEIGYVAIIALLAYVSCFAPGLGIVTWLIISEIYPLGIRGRAMSIATFANWLFNYAISISFLTLVNWLTIGGTYWLFTAISILCLFYIWKKVPETKGKTFAQIQAFWQK